MVTALQIALDHARKRAPEHVKMDVRDRVKMDVRVHVKLDAKGLADTQVHSHLGSEICISDVALRFEGSLNG